MKAQVFVFSLILFYTHNLQIIGISSKTKPQSHHTLLGTYLLLQTVYVFYSCTNHACDIYDYI